LFTPLHAATAAAFRKTGRYKRIFVTPPSNAMTMTYHARTTLQKELSFALQNVLGQRLMMRSDSRKSSNRFAVDSQSTLECS
jgi:hypothetical protein